MTINQGIKKGVKLLFNPFLISFAPYFNPILIPLCMLLVTPITSVVPC